MIILGLGDTMSTSLIGFLEYRRTVYYFIALSRVEEVIEIFENHGEYLCVPKLKLGVSRKRYAE